MAEDSKAVREKVAEQPRAAKVVDLIQQLCWDEVMMGFIENPEITVDHPYEPAQTLLHDASNYEVNYDPSLLVNNIFKSARLEQKEVADLDAKNAQEVKALQDGGLHFEADAQNTLHVQNRTENYHLYMLNPDEGLDQDSRIRSATKEQRILIGKEQRIPLNAKQKAYLKVSENFLAIPPHEKVPAKRVMQILMAIAYNAIVCHPDEFAKFEENQAGKTIIQFKGDDFLNLDPAQLAECQQSLDAFIQNPSSDELSLPEKRCLALVLKEYPASRIIADRTSAQSISPDEIQKRRAAAMDAAVEKRTRDEEEEILTNDQTVALLLAQYEDTDIDKIRELIKSHRITYEQALEISTTRSGFDQKLVKEILHALTSDIKFEHLEDLFLGNLTLAEIRSGIKAQKKYEQKNTAEDLKRGADGTVALPADQLAAAVGLTPENIQELISSGYNLTGADINIIDGFIRGAITTFDNIKENLVLGVSVQDIINNLKAVERQQNRGNVSPRGNRDEETLAAERSAKILNRRKEAKRHAEEEGLKAKAYLVQEVFHAKTQMVLQKRKNILRTIASISQKSEQVSLETKHLLQELELMLQKALEPISDRKNSVEGEASLSYQAELKSIKERFTRSFGYHQHLTQDLLGNAAGNTAQRTKQSIEYAFRDAGGDPVKAQLLMDNSLRALTEEQNRYEELLRYIARYPQEIQDLKFRIQSVIAKREQHLQDKVAVSAISQKIRATSEESTRVIHDINNTLTRLEAHMQSIGESKAAAEASDTLSSYKEAVNNIRQKLARSTGYHEYLTRTLLEHPSDNITLQTLTEEDRNYQELLTYLKVYLTEAQALKTNLEAQYPALNLMQQAQELQKKLAHAALPGAADASAGGAPILHLVHNHNAPHDPLVIQQAPKPQVPRNPPDV